VYNRQFKIIKLRRLYLNRLEPQSDCGENFIMI
jgi:hypothetical protein